MGTTTIGVKINDLLKERLKVAARRTGGTPHGLIKDSLVSALTRIEAGDAAAGPLIDTPGATADDRARPFLAFAQDVQPQSVLRARVTAATRVPEPEIVPLLVSEARLPEDLAADARRLARDLVLALRAKKKRGGVEGLLQEYSLSSQEGIALMCLAEALLRIPDRATRDALIRDKIALGDWTSHVGHSPSMFVNAATWGLVVTGRLTATASEAGLGTALTRLIGKGGEPLIRRGTDLAMRMMGEQFVTGQTIGEALGNSRRNEARGYRYSYDMLGEAATTVEDAARYLRDYEQAIHAIGAASNRRGIYEGPGLSIKLSALHPRYARAQRGRVMAELRPRLLALAVLARHYDVGINIDAEEADRLDLSLDLLEALCFAPELAGWNGIGFVIQAYQKRVLAVVDVLVDLGRRSNHRLMVRLVKGAYWDSEIKRAQVDGLEGFPVYTRKLHTDLSYLACARRLLRAPDAIFPQFATHNAQTLASIVAVAGENFYVGQYEFQCLHGMGEPLYDEVVGREGLNRPCRIYAPVGTHETLLAYLVRRLLENGANTSFVNRIADPDVAIDELIADPVTLAEEVVPLGAPHPRISLPRALFGTRVNAQGIDLSNEQRLGALAGALLAGADVAFTAGPMLVADDAPDGAGREIRNPADRRDVVGHAVDARDRDIEAAFSDAASTAPAWGAAPPSARAACLRRAADLLEDRMPNLIGLIVRESGKTLGNAVGEVREAVDFLRYYAAQAEETLTHDVRPLGPVVCISPWNFPLAIFVGQVAAALAAGNPVLAKPAEETPLIAAQAVALLRQAGIPAGAVQLLPGDGAVGNALVADPRCTAVMFTGSTAVARLIQKTLAERLGPDGKTIPFVAETGGLNAMVVDSSALAEQVVADVLQSAFDSAGQRCSALRVLFIQEEVAERTIRMLKGALAELSVGNPDRLSTDIGPVISAQAKDVIQTHVEAMRASGHPVHALPLPPDCRHGTFVAPTIIELVDAGACREEVFGPVLHVVRYRREALGDVLNAIGATGYGLTFGLHTRLDETIARVTQAVGAGNIYVNRNVIGAAVGVQPFGGTGLSGTGPKAGGPLYLERLVRRTGWPDAEATRGSETLGVLLDGLDGRPEQAIVRRIAGSVGRLGEAMVLPGPVGERNTYRSTPRGTVLAQIETACGFYAAVAAALATENRIVVRDCAVARSEVERLSRLLRSNIKFVDEARLSTHGISVVLHEGSPDSLAKVNREVAAWPGRVVQVHGVLPEDLASGRDAFSLNALIEEVVVSTNTAAAGGNASLMSIG